MLLLFLKSWSGPDGGTEGEHISLTQKEKNIMMFTMEMIMVMVVMMLVMIMAVTTYHKGMRGVLKRKFKVIIISFSIHVNR